MANGDHLSALLSRLDAKQNSLNSEIETVRAGVRDADKAIKDLAIHLSLPEPADLPYSRTAY